MRIVIKATNLDLTPPLKAYIDKKIGSLQKYLVRFEEEAEVKVEVEVARTTKHHHKGNVFYAEANARLLDTILRAEESAPDIRKAIDVVRQTLEREISKYKEKKVDRRSQ